MVRDIAQRMPGSVGLLLALMVVNGFTQGLSMALLYPLLTARGSAMLRVAAR